MATARLSAEFDAAVNSRYIIEKQLGMGAYGVVVKAKAKKGGKPVAIKKCFGCYNNTQDAARLVREICILFQLRSHPHVVQQIEVIHPTSAAARMDMYIVFEFLDMDVEKFYKQ